MSKIRIAVSSVDGYRKSKRFKTLKAAQKFAHEAIGAHPEMGGSYAVDGILGTTKVEVDGVSLHELFPEKTAAKHVSTHCECEYECDPNEGRTYDEPARPVPLKYDPLMKQHRAGICDYCVSPKGVAERRKAEEAWDREREKEYAARDTAVWGGLPGKIPF